MSDVKFDSLFRVMGKGATRRTLGRLLTGGALSGVAAQGTLLEPAVGKGKRKKRHKKNRCTGAFPVRCSPTADNPTGVCYPDGAVCCGSAMGGGACPPGEACCLPNPVNPGGSCAPAGYHCCPASGGGGYCEQYLPTCCPPTPQYPLGICLPTGYQCCSSAQGGGFCAEGRTCCPPTPEYPNGACAAAGLPCPNAVAPVRAHGGYESQMTDLPPGAAAKRGGNRVQTAP